MAFKNVIDGLGKGINDVAEKVASINIEEASSRILYSNMAEMSEKVAGTDVERLAKQVSTYTTKKELNSFVDKVIPEMSEANTIFKQKLSRAYNANDIEGLAKTLKESNFTGSGELADEIMEKYNYYNSASESAADKWSSIMSDKLKKTPLNNFMSAEEIDDFVGNEAMISNKQFSLYGLNGYRKFFNTSDKKLNRDRALVAGGTYLAGANAVRILKGGTPLTNENGESDIAGIPFI